MKHLLSYFLIILVFSSCQLFNPKPETEDFFCRINGKAFRPEPKAYSLPSQLTCELSKKNGRFIINAINGDKYIMLLLQIEPNTFPKVGSYLFSNDIKNNHSIFYYEYQDLTKKAISKKGTFIITKVEGYTISGTFEFEAYSEVNKKTYKIKYGQFNDLECYVSFF